jgi:hypothetical protein
LNDLLATVQGQFEAVSAFNHAGHNSVVGLYEAAEERRFFHRRSQRTLLHEFIAGPVYEVTLEGRVGGFEGELDASGHLVVLVSGKAAAVFSH